MTYRDERYLDAMLFGGDEPISVAAGLAVTVFGSNQGTIQWAIQSPSMGEVATGTARDRREALRAIARWFAQQAYELGPRVD